MNFHHVKIGGRPILAVSSDRSVSKSAHVSCYPVHTWKKRLVRSAIGLIFSTGLARWVWPAREVQLPGIAGGDLKNWLIDVRKTLGNDDLTPVIIWPADPDRGRLYLYLLDEGGQKKAFCKVALDDRNSLLIAREKEALERLQMLKLKSCRIPEILTSGLIAGRDFLAVELTPSSARITDWQRDSPIDVVISEYGGQHWELEDSDLKSLDWWPAVERLFSKGHSFRKAIDEAIRAGSAVCRVHGDLNQTNVLRDGEEIWLLDWEQSHEDGPALTDEVCAAVDQLWLENPNDPEGNLQRFKESFPTIDVEKTKHQIVLALAFLAAARFTSAIRLIEIWYPQA